MRLKTHKFGYWWNESKILTRKEIVCVVTLFFVSGWILGSSMTFFLTERVIDNLFNNQVVVSEPRELAPLKDAEIKQTRLTGESIIH